MDFCHQSNVSRLPRFVIAFLPRRKSINFMVTVAIHNDFGTQENSLSVSTFPPSICHEVMGLHVMILVFLNVEFEASFFTLFYHPHQEAL